MTDLHELLQQAAEGPAPASPLAADELFAEGRRRHRRRRRMVVGGAIAAAVLATVGTLTATSTLTALPRQEEPPADRGPSVVRQEPRPGVSGPGAIIQWAGAADAEHVYLAYIHCGGSPCRKDSFDLVGSDDGGHTWSDRTTGLAVTDWRVIGPGTLLATRRSTMELLTSVDGGRTWSELATRSSVKAVPDGGELICRFANGDSPCRLHAVDPRAGWLAPLSTQQPLRLDQFTSIVDVGGRLWLTGTNRATGRPAVAVSVDRGRTWSTHAFTEPQACSSACGAPSLATADGKTVYVMIGDTAMLQRFVYRSNDGQSWSRLDTGNVPYGREPGWSFVASDGSHVICAIGQRGQDVDECQFRAARDGTGYQRAELDGLPTPVHQVERAPDGWFYAVSYAPTSALYGSRDGLHWSRVAGG
jgi:photosystem II stability/assembly factor-like uncharacterized protein